MSKEFEEAVRKGAKVRTKKLPGGKYIHIAVLGKRKSIGGEVHKKKKGNPVPKKKDEEERRLKNARDKARRDKARDARIKGGKKKESWVAKLKKKVRKHFKSEKKKKEFKRAKDTDEQLRKNLSPEDIKRLQGKKK